MRCFGGKKSVITGDDGKLAYGILSCWFWFFAFMFPILVACIDAVNKGGRHRRLCSLSGSPPL